MMWRNKNILEHEIKKVMDWFPVEKEKYLLAMERSPVRDIEIKYISEKALTTDIQNREIYINGIDKSYADEGYERYKTEEL